jgi:hypothetical protein
MFTHSPGVLSAIRSRNRAGPRGALRHTLGRPDRCRREFSSCTPPSGPGPPCYRRRSKRVVHERLIKLELLLRRRQCLLTAAAEAPNNWRTAYEYEVCRARIRELEAVNAR